MDREYKTIRALRAGIVVDLDGLRLVMDGDGEVKQGDLYVAERNTGPQLLTAKEVNQDKNWIMPVDFPAYSFDIQECVRVKEV